MTKLLASILVCSIVGCAGAAPSTTVPPATPASAANNPEGAAGPAPVAPNPSSQGLVSVTSASPRAAQEFRLGRDALEDLRRGEAIEHFKRAVELDPNFALAHAFLATASPEADRAGFEKAAQFAPSLSEPERVAVEAMVAFGRGDFAKAVALRKRLTELVPGDWRAHWYFGMSELRNSHWEQAIVELRKAIELNPKASQPYNNLGYAYLTLGRKDEAIASLKKSAELVPNQPNVYDSLGDALLAASRLEDAEVEYKRAFEVSASAWFAWGGVAATRSLRSDWKGAYDALAIAAKGAQRPDDQLEVRTILAWTRLSEGKTVDGMDGLAAVEKDAQAHKLAEWIAIAGFAQALVLVDMGKAKESLKKTDEFAALAEKNLQPGADFGRERWFALVARATAEEKLGRKDELLKTLAEMKAEATKRTESADAQSHAAYVQGLAMLAEGDTKEAAMHFSKCVPLHLWCARRAVEVLTKAGDNAGAAKVKQTIVATPIRDGWYLYVRATLGTLPKPKA